MNKFSYPKRKFIEFEGNNNNGVAILLLKFQFQQKIIALNGNEVSKVKRNHISHKYLNDDMEKFFSVWHNNNKFSFAN